MEASGAIKEPLIRELLQAGASISASIVGKEKGFAVVFGLGHAAKTLITSRGTTRLFASLDTAATFVRDLGIIRFDVDMAAHRPGRLRKPRPDRAEALRHTRTRMQQQSLGLTL